MRAPASSPVLPLPSSSAAAQRAAHEPAAAAGTRDAEDERLLAAHRAGDARAFSELVRRYQEPIYRLALRFARDPDEADELAQRTFLRAFAHAATLEPRHSFRAFLYRVASNLCRNHLRDRARLVFGVPLDVAAPEGESLEQLERRRRVRESLARLPLRQRQVMSLRIDAGLPFAEIAEALGITENNAKVNYHHAVRRLQALLGEEEL